MFTHIIIVDFVVSFLIMFKIAFCDSYYPADIYLFKVSNRNTKDKAKNKDTRTMPVVSFCCLYCQLGTYFTPCSSASIVNFEHVIASWV